MSLQDFAKNKGIATPGAVTAPSSVKPSSLADFAKNKGQNVTPTPITPEVKKPSVAGNVLRWTGKQLMKPVGVVAKLSENIGLATSGDLGAVKSTPKDVTDILTGKSTYSFTDLWREYLPEHPTAATIIGLVSDLAADPTNLVGGGLTKTGKLAEQATKLSKAGTTIAEGSKLANKIEKAGMTAKDLELAVTKAEQAAKGQRAFLQIADKPVLPAKASEAIYKATGKAGKAIKSIPIASKATEGVKSIFSTATKNPEFDALERKMTDLLDYRKAKVLEGAKIIQKSLNGLKADEVLQVSNYLEKGVKPTIPALTEIGDRLKTAYKEYYDIEKEFGLIKNEVLNYTPHIRTKANEKIIETEGMGKNTTSDIAEMVRTGNLAGSMDASLKNIDSLNPRGFMESPKPRNPGDASKAIKFLDPVKWSISLGNAEKRTILKFIDEKGKSVIGTADNLGLYKTGDLREGGKVVGSVYKDANGKPFTVGSGTKQATVEDINKAFNKQMFHENPAIQLAYRGIGSAKAITSKEFLNEAKKFVSKVGAETAIPGMEGMKFEPGIAKHLNDYYAKMQQPAEITGVLKMFDAVQNWWKGQALISPSYHIRNFVGNLWNNFLAGVTNPTHYVDAGVIQLGGEVKFVDDIGRQWTSKNILDEASKNGVLNKGWYAGDIEKEVTGELGKGKFNPLSQSNMLFKGNQKVGSVVENNARLANFIYQLKKGLPPVDAAMEVKKYLFDYQSLTGVEKNVLKRLMPFYTFTRKNVPLQLNNLMRQPGKYAGLEKVVQAVEKFGMGDDKPANEKYLSDYIQSNTAMRMNYNEKTKSYNYFLLGNWLPAYQAMDFLSQPLPNLLSMLSPILKTPIEMGTNTSSFWKNTIDEYQNIERYPGEQTNYLGLNMPKKTAQLLRNIRLLNDLDKLNPGNIFGGKKGQDSIWSKAKLPAVNIPGVGNISPSKYKYSPTTTNPSGLERGVGFLSSKLVNYNPSVSRDFYNQDTDNRVAEFKSAIAKAAKSGDAARAKLISQQMKDFIRARGR